MEKNIKYEECNFVIDGKGVLKRHIHAKHTLKNAMNVIIHHYLNMILRNIRIRIMLQTMVS